MISQGKHWMEGNPAFDAKESPAKVMQLSPFVQGNRSKRKEQWQQETLSSLTPIPKRLAHE